MNNSGIIQTSKSSDLVTHKILIDGNELSGIHLLVSIAITKEANRIPTAKLVFIDGDAATGEFNLSNEDLLIPGSKIEITAGYHSDEETIFKGIVIKHNIRIRTNSSQLIVECKDEVVKLTVGRKSKYYYESTDSEIFEEILARYPSLSANIESTSNQHAEIVQYNTTDWDFIISRAQANGLLCFVNDGEMRISKPNLKQTEVETVTFGATLLEFDAEIDARNQVKKVISFGWNSANQEVLELESIDPNVSLHGNLSSADLAETINEEQIELRHGGNIPDTQLQTWADAKLLFQQLSKIRGRAKFQGIPTVLPDTILNFEGVGDRFNGKAYITGISHVIASGNWTINAQFGLSPKWFAETINKETPAASGLFPGIGGLQIGLVSQLQDDPDGEDRILVQIPIIDSKEKGIWCRIASLDAGDGRGAFFRPEIKDEVIVGFINEDPNDAVVLGMLHSSSLPSPITASDENNEKGFITRSELKVLFDDDKKSIEISTPTGKVIKLDEDAATIIIEDDHSNIVTLDSDGIKIESMGDIELKATGDVNIEGMNVNLKANAEFKAEGSAGVEVSTGAIAVLKGSLVQIN